MSQFFHIHPDNPQQRLIKQAVQLIQKGGIVNHMEHQIKLLTLKQYA